MKYSIIHVKNLFLRDWILNKCVWVVFEKKYWDWSCIYERKINETLISFKITLLGIQHIFQWVFIRQSTNETFLFYDEKMS